MIDMESKIAFVSFVSSEHSVDYWSDVAIEHAIELADAMPPSGWATLCETWESLEPMAQARIAEVASETANWSADISKMLVAMLSSNSPDVVEASLDSLNSICQLSPDRLNGKDLRLALDRVTPSDTVVARVLESLKQRVDAES